MSLKSEDILMAWSAFFEAHAFAVQRVDESLVEGEAPLSIHEYDVLLTISRSVDRRIRYSELADASIYSKSGVTRVAKRMEKRGFIEREKCEVDRRGAYATLTKDGQQALRQSWELYSRAVLEFLQPALTQGEARELSRLMEKVIAQLKPTPLVTIGSNGDR